MLPFWQLKSHIFTAILAFCLSSAEAYAQVYGPLPESFNTLRQNSSSTIELSDSRAWIGPGLNWIDLDDGEIGVPVTADSVFSGRGRVFSFSVQQDRILAGLGYTSDRTDTPVNAAMGYYRSLDNGNSWNFIPFPLDDPPPPGSCEESPVGTPCDIEFQYGEERYLRTRITVPEQSPPFEVDFAGSTILSVNWASGLLRSRDNGESWGRLILPPSGVTQMNPGDSLAWFSRTPDGETVNRYDPRFDNNLLGFGLLIDSDGRVWVGTAGGINISENALTAPIEEIRWRRTAFDPENPDGLLANWIISIREQPGTNRIWMTNWRTDPQNRDSFGIVSTSDLGSSFQHYLEGVRVNDIGFTRDAIFAASDEGLYISRNGGESWDVIREIDGTRSFIGAGARFFTVSGRKRAVWVGTSDGIAFSQDEGESWEVIRTEVPLSGGSVYQPDAPDVEAYAYPNPFSPTLHDRVRIKFKLNEPGEATLRIFDFGMNLVRTIPMNPVGSAGTYETVWDGRTESGRIVANGTYFYSIRSEGGQAEGKILLLD